jgi:DNA-binding transcriptional ArsR family regulator
MENTLCIRVFADAGQIESCRNRLVEVESAIDGLAGALSLAGNGVRLRILFLLNEEERLCVCDLSDILGMKIPAVSQHLRKMKDGGMLVNEKVAQTIYYRLVPEYKTLFAGLMGLVATGEILEEAR